MVRFENVGLRYGMGPEVLRDITFSIEPQSFQFLTGPSGAGKTTLLRLILLSLKPTRGLIDLFGHDVNTIDKDTLTALRRRMGVVFQDFRLLEHLTTYENVALPLRVQGRDEASYRGRSGGAAALGGTGRADARAPPGPLGWREATRRDRPRPDRPARTCCWPTSRPAMSIRRWRAACCASSPSSTGRERPSSSPPTTSR